MVFGIVPSKNGNQCPRKCGLSSLYNCLLCLPLCSACYLSFQLKLNWLPCWEGASHSVIQVCCRKNVLFYVFYFPPGVYVGAFNLIASIPGPSILTLYRDFVTYNDKNINNLCFRRVTFVILHVPMFHTALRRTQTLIFSKETSSHFMQLTDATCIYVSRGQQTTNLSSIHTKDIPLDITCIF